MRNSKQFPLLLQPPLLLDHLLVVLGPAYLRATNLFLADVREAGLHVRAVVIGADLGVPGRVVIERLVDLGQMRVVQVLAVVDDEAVHVRVELVVAAAIVAGSGTATSHTGLCHDTARALILSGDASRRGIIGGRASLIVGILGWPAPVLCHYPSTLGHYTALSIRDGLRCSLHRFLCPIVWFGLVPRCWLTLWRYISVRAAGHSRRLILVTYVISRIGIRNGRSGFGCRL